MNINSNTTSAIVDSLFRLVRDGSVLRGGIGVLCGGIGVLRERLESRRLFMLLDRSHGALVCCVPIDLSGAMHLKQVCYVWRCRASETKHETYSVT